MAEKEKFGFPLDENNPENEAEDESVEVEVGDDAPGEDKNLAQEEPLLLLLLQEHEQEEEAAGRS